MHAINVLTLTLEILTTTVVLSARFFGGNFLTLVSLTTIELFMIRMIVRMIESLYVTAILRFFQERVEAAESLTREATLSGIYRGLSSEFVYKRFCSTHRMFYHQRNLYSTKPRSKRCPPRLLPW